MKKKTAELFSPALRNDLTELVARSFAPAGIDELGRLVFGAHSSHDLSGTDRHITISAPRAARLLVERAQEAGRLADVIQLLAELDGGVFLGKRLQIREIEVFFHALARIGVVYDPGRRKLTQTSEEISQMKNWGSLRDGRSYPVTVMSLDIVGNSGIVRAHGNKTVEKLYFALWRYLERKLDDYDGRIWNWAGDGGIMAFTFEGHESRALMCAIDIQTSLPLFNISPEKPIPERVELRLALDSGRVTFYADTGRIVSEVINYAAHLEKGGTEPGMVSISERVERASDERLLSIFRQQGPFEGSSYATTTSRLDLLFGDAAGCEDQEATAD